jgi:hypothetical protein
MSTTAKKSKETSFSKLDKVISLETYHMHTDLMLKRYGKLFCKTGQEGIF